jgi:hypothetical protein
MFGRLFGHCRLLHRECSSERKLRAHNRSGGLLSYAAEASASVESSLPLPTDLRSLYQK